MPPTPETPAPAPDAPQTQPDANGQLIAVGDLVTIHCRVVAVSEGGAANVVVKPIGNDPHRPRITLNSLHLVKLEEVLEEAPAPSRTAKAAPAKKAGATKATEAPAEPAPAVTAPEVTAGAS